MKITPEFYIITELNRAEGPTPSLYEQPTATLWQLVTGPVLTTNFQIEGNYMTIVPITILQILKCSHAINVHSSHLNQVLQKWNVVKMSHIIGSNYNYEVIALRKCHNN